MKKLLIVLMMLISFASWGQGLKSCLEEFETTIGDPAENDEFMNDCLSKGFKVDSDANLGVCYIKWVQDCVRREEERK